MSVIATLDEVALLLMMQHPDDTAGFALVLDSLQSLTVPLKETQLIELDAELADILHRSEKHGAPFLQLLRDWVSKAQQRLSQKSEATVVGWRTAWGADIGTNFDEALISEFIDTHLLKLEEFELELVEAAQGRSVTPDELTRRAKAYLHNLKGDAGTVGMAGIERVTHQIEDQLVRHGALELLEKLRAFKDWAATAIQEVSRPQAPSELSNAFLSRIVQEGEVSDRRTASEPVAHATDSAAEIGSTNPLTYELTGDPDVLVEFTAEAEDHLEKVESILLGSESSCSADDINAIFRAVHSIKGGSSYFNLVEMTRSSHLLENLLDRVRKGSLEINQQLKEYILKWVDFQKTLFADARTAMNGDRVLSSRIEVAQFISVLEAFSNEGAVTSPVLAVPCPIKKIQPDDVPVSTKATELASSVAEPSALTPRANPNSERADLKTFVKVDTNRLDHLIEYIGELVISSSMLIKSCRDRLHEHEAVMSNAHQLEQITREIQGIGMSMRLVPIKGLLQKMSRLVWDTSKKIGKEISFETEGEDTELDRTVIDRLADPLMHMIRNSVDHGIELPEERMKAGKPRSGAVRVSASHLGGAIHIKISDDGRGLDRDRLLRKAIEKGLANPNQEYSAQEIYNFIFAAGFSTAEKVTDISGRGVGMDVVRRNIEAMRGRIHIDSKLGSGTTFTIELPLTLAIIDGIETKVGEERFIIPTHSVVEFVKPKPAMLSASIDRAETFEFRGRSLPLFRLSELNDSIPRFFDPCQGIVVVIEVNREMVALLIDEVVGSYSTVIKPLGPTFQHVRGLAGAAIMPDGNIGLIVDTVTLVQLARERRTRRTYRRSSDAEGNISPTVIGH